MARLGLEFTLEAQAEFTEGTDWAIDRFGEKVALAYARGLKAACERLRDFPELAPVHPGVEPTTRVLHHRSHRVFYIVEPERILIVRILHHARDLPPAL